jgi:hypothetical protein
MLKQNNKKPIPDLLLNDNKLDLITEEEEKAPVIKSTIYNRKRRESVMEVLEDAEFNKIKKILFIINRELTKNELSELEFYSKNDIMYFNEKIQNQYNLNQINFSYLILDIRKTNQRRYIEKIIPSLLENENIKTVIIHANHETKKECLEWCNDIPYDAIIKKIRKNSATTIELFNENLILRSVHIEKPRSWLKKGFQMLLKLLK